jgi:NAD(P)-dependent dehydrogenase (short-subunit alcohol dehydrogenase family)
MSDDLTGRRALVTGAARGLGLAVAELFLERGATVMISDRDGAEAEAQADRLGENAHANACDVTDSEQVQAMIEATTSALGGLDILVNNAGIEISKPMPEHSDEEFLTLLKINVYGVFLCTKYAVPALADGGGNIVNMASVAGLGGAPLLSAYTASKAAVIGFTETCAIELRDAGIRVNAVCPSFIGTEMVERMVPIYEEILPLPFDEVVKIKQGRLGTAAEVAETVAFLASDDASWTTGSHYTLDNALTASLL